MQTDLRGVHGVQHIHHATLDVAQNAHPVRIADVDRKAQQVEIQDAFAQRDAHLPQPGIWEPVLHFAIIDAMLVFQVSACAYAVLAAGETSNTDTQMQQSCTEAHTKFTHQGPLDIVMPQTDSKRCKLKQDNCLLGKLCVEETVEDKAWWQARGRIQRAWSGIDELYECIQHFIIEPAFVAEPHKILPP